MYDLMRQFNVYMKTDLETVYLGSAFAMSPLEAKTIVLSRNLPTLNDARSKGVKYTVIAEANPTTPMYK